MPTFILPIGDRQTAPKTFAALDYFTQGYVEAMFWTDYNADSYDGLSDATFSDLACEALTKIMRDCEAFQSANAALLDKAYERGYTEEQAGHDYWLTRNGHGAGYWDRSELEDNSEEYERLTAIMVANHDNFTAWGEALRLRQALSSQSLGKRLSAAASLVGSVDLYRGDDGKVYVS